MSRVVVPIPVLSDAIGRLGAPLSLVARAGSTIYVSGLPPYSSATGELDSGDIRSQTRTCLDSLTACLAAAGATLDDVVNIRVYADPSRYGEINDIYREYFPQGQPSRTFVPVAEFPGPFQIEIDAVAWID